EPVVFERREGLVRRRFTFPRVEALLQTWSPRRMGQRRFVGLDRKVEVALAIGNLAKKRRRFGQRRLEFDRRVQAQRRVMCAALQLRRDAGPDTSDPLAE